MRDRWFRWSGARSVGVALLWLTLAVATPISAQENPFSINGAPQKHASESVMGVDHVDPLSGNLLLAHTDLALPGNAGLDLRITRYYNSNIHRHFADGDYSYEEPSWVGVGWRLHFGRVIRPDSQVPGALQIEMPDGSRHPVYQVSPGDPWWRSADFFLYNPTTAVLKLPNGLVYTFGHLATASDGGELGAMRYVTEIRDPFDNTLTFSYFAAPGPTGGVQQIQQDLGSGQVRTVTFTYDPESRRLGSMTYNGRTWSYFVFPSASPGHWLLRYVRVPEAAGGAIRRWTYYYGMTVPGEELGLMKSPTGAEHQYFYDTITRTADTQTYPARVVWRRTVVADWDTPVGTWNFSYNQGDALNETHVQGPAGRTVYRYDGIGTAGPFNVWRTGTLTRRSRYSPSDVELERETFSYVRSDLLINVPVGDPNDPWYDDGVYRALLSQQTVDDWTTYFDYHWGDGSFNDYGLPYRIWQWPYYAGREIRRTYHPPSAFTPYLVGRLATEDVRYSDQAGHFLDTNITWRDCAYDPATGFMTGMRVQGVTTTFTPTSRGNVASATDARSVSTTYQYAWGAVSRVETPLSLTVRTIPGPDPVPTAESVGKAPDAPLTTTYTYDALGRLRTVTPPGSTGAEPSPAPWIYTYDDASAIPTWTAVSRGYGTATVDKTFTDVYGRVRRTERSGGTTPAVKTGVSWDAEGREVFRSAPYTGETVPARGTWFTYDALNRLTRIVSGAAVENDPDHSETVYAYTGSPVSGARRTTVTDPKGFQTHYDYVFLSGPGDGRLVKVTDAKNQVTQYEYRLTSTLTKATGPGCPPGDETCTLGAGPVRTWTYNPTTNRLSDEQHPESGLVQYSQYDAVGNATEIKKRRADGTFETTTLTYDALNRPLTRTTDAPVYGVTWTYDTLGRTTAVTGEVTTTYGFEAATGRLASRTDTRPGQWAFTSLYVLDGRDRLTRMTYRPYSGAPRHVDYTYDEQGRLSSVTNNGAPFATGFHYDASGRLDSYVTGSVTHAVAYDQQDRVDAVTTAGVQGPNLNVAYTHDRAGNVASLTDGGVPQTFEYDALHRLTGAVGPWGTLGWTYDPTGNRTTETGGAVTTYQYDAATNRLASTGGTAPETFTYDGFGRLTQDSQGTYTYRPDGAVVSATRAGMTATYLSDGDGLRVERTVNGQRVVTVRGLGGEVLSEYEAEGCAGAPLVWQRDFLYAGSRLLGAVKNATARPTVAFAAATGSAAENTANVTVTVSLTAPTPLACPVSVSYQTHNLTATAGQDYGTATGLLTFPAGSPSGTTLPIAVSLLDDLVAEGDEAFTVTLATPIGAGLGPVSATTVTVLDNDPASSVSLNDASATEAAGAHARFTISVSPVNSQSLTFTYATANETASAGLDYVAATGSVTVPPLTASVTLDVGVLPDFLLESSETFTLTLTPTSARATMARGTGRATIADTPPPTFRGDFNGDGKPDVVWRHATSGENQLWYLDNVTLVGQAALPAVADPAWQIVAVADFDADGHTDLIWRNAVTGWNAVWLLEGATLVWNQSLLPPVSDLNWQIVAAADINRDGKPDLVWRNRVTGYNAVWFLDGITYVSEALLDPVTDLAWQIVAAGDFNGDGKADLVWRNTTTGSNVVWYLDGTTFLAQAWLPPLADTSWELGMAADLDGNGKLDLVWRRPTTGENVVWYLDGVTLLSQAALPPLAGADWHIQRDRR